jgi:DNA-binding NtrC family response regulator
MTHVVLAVGLLLAIATPAAGALYRWVDAAGVTYYTSDRSTIPERYRNSAKELEHPSAREPQPSASPSPTASPPAGAVVPLAQAEAAFEKQTLEHALLASNGQITEAAKRLRISRATFYKKLAKLGLASGSAPV